MNGSTRKKSEGFFIPDPTSLSVGDVGPLGGKSDVAHRQGYLKAYAGYAVNFFWLSCVGRRLKCCK